jgi:hypothetical protein
MIVGDQLKALAAFTPRNNPGPIVQVVGWAPGPGPRTAAKSPARTGIWALNRRVRSKSLYRLRYPSPGTETFTNLSYINRHENANIQITYNTGKFGFGVMIETTA